MIGKEPVIGNLLPAVAYGDSVGLPYETKPPQPPHSVTGLQAIDNPYVGKHPRGTWSDDTHLSLAVTKSLLAADGFDMNSQADWHVKALQHVEGASDEPDLVPPVVTSGRRNGWGKSTTDSVRRLQAGVPPAESGAPDGAGNGVLMKLAPLLVWQVGRRTSRQTAEAQVVQFTEMTHRAPEAVVASLVHADYVRRLLGEQPVPSSQALLIDAVQAAKSYEKLCRAEPAVSEMLARVASSALVERQPILEAAPGGGFYAPETLAMAYGSLALEPTYPNSVYRAVELGGDADSIGSIVGVLSVLRSTVYRSPADHDQVFAYPRLSRLSAELARAVTGKRV